MLTSCDDASTVPLRRILGTVFGLVVNEMAVGTDVGLGHDRARLSDDLVRLGVCEGSILLVQASLRAVAPAGRAPEVVVGALLDVLGPEGTLVVPTYTSMNSTTSRAFKAETEHMTQEEIDAYAESLPAFDPDTTPSSGVGVLAECVRTLPDAIRSTHPQTSFAAVGARSAELMKIHELESHLGENSPLGALHAFDAMVLMLGTEYSTSTIFHLAEYAYVQQPLRTYEAKIAGAPGDSRPGSGEWVSFEDIDFDDSDFDRLGEVFEQEKAEVVSRGTVGGAPSRLFPTRSAIDFAVEWMQRNRA